MDRDYFVVGRTCVLRTETADIDPAVFELAIWDGQRVRGRIGARVSADAIVMSISESDVVPIAMRAEAYQLLARTCPQHFGRALPLDIENGEGDDTISEQLEADGFRRLSVGRWRRDPAAFIRNGKARDMDVLYDDPLSVPWNFVPREHDVLDLLRAAAAARGGDLIAVLDLGCGFGKNATFLEEHGFPVFGIDVSTVAIERCRQLVRSPDRYVPASANRLPFASHVFDYVLDIGCLHCMPPTDRDDAVHEIARVLVPGGTLFSRIFNVRPKSWVDALPFHAAAFGMEPAAACALFSGRFSVTSPPPTPHVSYFVCRNNPR